jgi:hypothetical protein
MRRWGNIATCVRIAAVAAFLLPVLAPGVDAESIFARDALGRWVEPYDLRAEGMGGVAVAVRDSFPHSQHNPATYAFASRSSGYVSVYPEIRWIRLPDEIACPEGAGCEPGDDQRQNGGRLGSLHGIITVGTQWRIGIGIRQINDPSYVVINEVNVGQDDEATREEKGTGGILAYTLGAAWRPWPNLAVGVEGAVISGTIRDIVRYEFSNSRFQDTRDDVTTKIKNGLGARVGALWSAGRLSVGAFYATAVDEDKGRRSWRNSDGFQAKETFEMRLPASAGWGFVWDIGRRWRAGADFVWRGWADGEFPERDGNGYVLEDTWRFGAGFERVGRMSPQSGFGEGISWRFGVSYDPWYFEDSMGNHAREIAASAGMGLPIARDRGHIDLALRLGRRSVEEIDRPDEIFLQIGLGATYGSMPRGY